MLTAFKEEVALGNLGNKADSSGMENHILIYKDANKPTHIEDMLASDAVVA